MTSIEKLLKKLVSFQSITGDFSESKKLLNWVEKQINKSLIVKYFYSNKFPSLIATTRKTKTPKIFLVAHIDVVPAAKKMFHLKVKSDKFVARGVFDMKFALACYLQLIKDLKHNIKKFDFGLMLTADEEIGGFNGVKFLIDNGFNSKILFLPDGGENWSIQNVAKGVLHLTAEIQGKTAHGSRPWEGEEPFTELFAFLNELKKLFPVEPCGDIKHYHNSINIGKIIGGQAINQVASSVKTYIDIRHIPEVTKTKILKEIYKIKTKYSKVKIKEIAYGQSYKIDFKKPEILLWKKFAKDMFNIKINQTFSHGTCDARFFNTKKTVMLVTRPTGGKIHSEEEWINRKELANFYILLKKWVMAVAV